MKRRLSRRSLRTTFWRSTLLVVGGCSVGPDFEAPAVQVPAEYKQVAPAQDELREVTDLGRWWNSFQDPLLSRLITRAVQANFDLQTATARVREARALLAVSRSGFLPDVNTTAALNRSKASKNAQFAVSNGGSNPQLGGGRPQNFLTTPQNIYEVGFDATWEIDIFGGVRREVESAIATYEGSIDARRGVLVSLIAEVASNYIMLRGSQAQLRITEDNVAAQQETVELERLRLNAGISSDLTVAQAEAQLRTTESRIPSLEAPIQQAIHRLSVLVGAVPGALEADLSAPDSIPQSATRPVPGVPAELLRRRPDIRRAENALAAATANIGVAVADLFPRFQLTGRLGLRSRQSGDLFNADSEYWAGGPNVSWDILNWAAILSNIEIQNARQEQAILTYKQTVLLALEEVENALLAINREQDRRQRLAASVEANRKALDLAVQLNTAGVGNFLNVLTGQRALLDAEDALVQSDRTIAVNLVALYKALGGGWETEEELAANPDAPPRLISVRSSTVRLPPVAELPRP